jgi:Cu-processing system ATP-binding protein
MITFRAFRKQFGSQTAVDGLTLEVRRGETLALLGPNGSGKTTTLKAAAGLVRPTSGRVDIGEPGREASDAAARRVVSFLPQRVSFPEALTGREVLEFYRALRAAPRERTDAALRFASLNGAAARAVGTYSGGMVQRLGLAVAVLPGTPVFLLDEPTAALDPEGLAAFYRMVEGQAREGRTVLFTSHQLGDAERLADRFAVLVGGRLVAVMTQRDLHGRLAERGKMRVRLEAVPDGLVASIRALAPATVVDAGDIVIPGPPAIRPAALDIIRSAGATILGLTAEEGRLDALYRELVTEAS